MQPDSRPCSPLTLHLWRRLHARLVWGPPTMRISPVIGPPLKSLSVHQHFLAHLMSISFIQAWLNLTPVPDQLGPQEASWATPAPFCSPPSLLYSSRHGGAGDLGMWYPVPFCSQGLESRYSLSFLSLGSCRKGQNTSPIIANSPLNLAQGNPSHGDLRHRAQLCHKLFKMGSLKRLLKAKIFYYL